VRLAEHVTRWKAWARYSARQGRRIEWTGLVGPAIYEADLAPLWPYLVLGQWVHVGKGVTFGLGRYRLEPIDPEENPDKRAS
jgi:CRISPR/Cas system endoribonuclease Cas6 (RAMP superfamily)